MALVSMLRVFQILFRLLLTQSYPVLIILIDNFIFEGDFFSNLRLVILCHLVCNHKYNKREIVAMKTLDKRILLYYPRFLQNLKNLPMQLFVN